MAPLSAVAAVVVTLLAAVVLAAVWYSRAEESPDAPSATSQASAAASEPAEEAREPSAKSEPVVFDKSEANPTGDAVSAARRAVRDGLAPMLYAEAYLAADKFGPARRMAIRAMANRGITSRVEDVYDAAIQ